MLVAFNRVSTLAEKSESKVIEKSLFEDDSEAKLYKEFLVVDKEISELISQKEYTKSLDKFATLKGSIDKFFDSVMVMDNNEKIKNNRLALLDNIYSSMLQICDLSKIVYK